MAVAASACPVNRRIAPAVSAQPTPWHRRLLILPPISVGVAIVAFAIRTQAPPEQAPLAERSLQAQVPKPLVTSLAFGLATATLMVPVGEPMRRGQYRRI